MSHRVLAGLISLAVPALAAPPAVVPSPQEIVVTASRDARPASELPGRLTVVPRERIAESGAASVVEILDRVAGIHLRSTSGNPAQAEIDMRGFGENSHGRVLVLLDGQPLNRPDQAGVDWLQIPLSQIERIEVLHGGRSALYGDHAVGGVVNLVTRPASSTPETRLEALGGSHGLYSGSARTRGAAGPLLYSADVQRDAADGYRERSGYESWNAGLSLGGDLGETATATLRLGYSLLDFELPGYLTRAQMRADPRQSVNPADESQNEYWTAALRLGAAAGRDGRVEADLTWLRRDMESDVPSWSSFADTLLDAFGVAPRYVLERPAAGRPNRLLAGVDWRYESMGVDRYGDLDRTARSTDAEILKETLGFYASDRLQLTDRWSVELGGRTEEAKYTAEVKDGTGARVVDDETTHRADVIEGGLGFKAGEAARLFARAGQVYRFPFLDEQVSYYGFGSDRIYQNLDLETGENYEIGAELTPASSVTLGVTLFRLNMHDQIAYNGVTMQNENLADTRHEGVETTVAWIPCSWFRLDAGYAYTDAEFDAGPHDGRELPLVPVHKANLAGEVRLPWHLTARAAASYVGEQRPGGDYDNNAERLEAYTVVDALLRFDAVRPKGLSVFAGVDNISGEEYASVAYEGLDVVGYYPSPERTWKAGLSWTF